MSLAEDAAFVEGEFFAGAELATAGVAGETGQVVDVLPCPSHPIGRRDGSTAAGAFGSERPDRLTRVNKKCCFFFS
jgi:hypothetical protein